MRSPAVIVVGLSGGRYAQAGPVCGVHAALWWMRCSTANARACDHCVSRTAGVPQYHCHRNYRWQAAGGERLRLSCGRRKLAVRLALRPTPVPAATVRVCLLRTSVGLVVAAVRRWSGDRFFLRRTSFRSFPSVRPPRPRLHGTRKLLAPHAQLINPAALGFQTAWTAWCENYGRFRLGDRRTLWAH